MLYSCSQWCCLYVSTAYALRAFFTHFPAFQTSSKTLWQIDEGNINAFAALLEIIATTKDGFLLSDVATYLVRFEPKNAIVISALTERTQTTTDEHIRLRAAASLLEFDVGNKLAIAVLSEIILYTDLIGYHSEAAYSLLHIDPSNQLATTTLLKHIEQDDPSLRTFLENLCDFVFKDPNAIVALTQFIASTKYSCLLPAAAYSLAKIDPGNQIAISTFIEFIQTNEPNTINFHDAEYRVEHCSYNFRLSDAADKLQEILPNEQMPQVVVALKDYLFKPNWDNSYCYEVYDRVIWHCAQNMTYPDFYAAWHKLP